MSQERLHSIDIVKGIAIICIVIGHMGFRDAAGNNIAEPWLYPFHVPVFFVVAGYFLNTKYSLRDFVVQKAQRLLLPYLAVSIAIVFYTALLQAIHGGNTWPSAFANTFDAVLAALYGTGSWYTPTPLDIAPIGAIWFLPALFFALTICRVSLQWRFGWIATVALAVAAFATAPLFWLPLSFQSGCVGALFIMLGVFLHKRDFLNRRTDWLAVLVCACLYIIAGIYDLKLSLASLLTATSIPIALVMDAGSSILVLYAARLLDDNRKGKGTRRVIDMVDRVLEYYGKGSLTVLCVHLFMIDIGVNSMVELACGLSGNALCAVLLVVHLGLTGVCITLFRHTPGLRALWP